MIIFVVYMGKIYLKNIQLYAYHGCMMEEEKIGSDYVVNVVISTDLSQSSKSDNLKDNVDYVSIYIIVKEEMSIRSNLLEKVGDRILKRILKEHRDVIHVKIKVAKINPPIGGNVKEVAIKRELDRSRVDFD